MRLIGRTVATVRSMIAQRRDWRMADCCSVVYSIGAVVNIAIEALLLVLAAALQQCR